MARYHNTKVAKMVGNKLKEMREAAGITLKDAAALTGFSEDTIMRIESGSDTDITHITDLSMAYGRHPRDAFDFDLEIVSRFKLVKNDAVVNQQTAQVIELISKGFFSEERSAKEVCDKLEEINTGIPRYETKSISVILSREVTSKRLTFTTKKRKNYYKKK